MKRFTALQAQGNSNCVGLSKHVVLGGGAV